MKILKKGGSSREKGEEETKSMPHAPVWMTDVFSSPAHTDVFTENYAPSFIILK